MKKLKLKIKLAMQDLLRWVFKSELEKLQRQLHDNEVQTKRIKNLLDNLDVSVDVHYRANSWAVISIQGERSDFIKFIDLGRKDIAEIHRFLQHFDRAKIDAEPRTYELLKFPKRFKF